MRIDRKQTDIAPGKTLRPLRDHLVIAPLEWRPSAIIDIAGDKRKTLRGTVIACGPGTYRKIYNAPKGPNRTSYRDSKNFQATEVRVGDVVELGGLEIDGYGFTEIVLGNEKVIICREPDVVAVHERTHD